MQFVTFKISNYVFKTIHDNWDFFPFEKLKMPKGISETVTRRGQTTQRPKQRDIASSDLTNTTQKTNYMATLKTGEGL